MKVKITKQGFYNNQRIKEGATIVLSPIKGKIQDEKGNLKDHVFTPEEQFSPKWMKKLDSEDGPAFVSKLPKGKKAVEVVEALDVI